MSTPLFDYNINHDECQEFLFDNEKLLHHMRLKESALNTLHKACNMANKSEKYFFNMQECGHYIGVNKLGQVVEANFCKSRFCPVCQWKRSLVTFHRIKSICDLINSEQDVRYILLTVTQKNVYASFDTLHEELNRILYSYKKFRQFARIKKAALGMIKTLEVTYNPERNEFHPHIHVIICVPPKYFKKGSELYIKHDEFCELWKTALCDWKNVVCDVKAIKNDDEKGISGAVAEVSKYAVKLNSVASKGGALTLSHVMQALHNRRLFTMSGIFLKTARRLGITEENISDFDTVSIDENGEIVSEKHGVTPYIYTKGNYKRMKKQ